MSRLVAQLLRTVVLVGAVWIGSVCLLGDRERGERGSRRLRTYCHAAGFEAIHLLICMEVSRFGDPAPSVLFSRLAVTIERLTRTLSRPCSRMYLVLLGYLSLIYL